MKKISIYLSALLLIMTLLALNSCTDIDEGEIPLGEGESIVEMSFFTSSPTRAIDKDEIAKGTTMENTIETLDLLVFKEDKFLYRRHAVRHMENENIFRATLSLDDPVTTGLTVHFLANVRPFVEKLVEDNELVVGSSWETIRSQLILIEEDPTAAKTTLPMWGKKDGLKVTENIIEYWGNINLIRAVAGVDIYMNDGVDNFVLTNAYLYNVPDRGFLAPSKIEFNANTGEYTIESGSPLGMQTHKDAANTPIVIGPIAPENDETKITNKFYLYDNDTHEGSFTVNKKYTRIVVEGRYKDDPDPFYYPIDFLTEVKNEDGDILKLEHEKIVRNTKYVFEISQVTGPGYRKPDIASLEPPVHMTANIYKWDVRTDTESGYDGLYYVSLERKEAVLSRAAESTDYIKFTSNAKPEVITVKMVDADGKEVASTDIENGKKTEWFSVEKVLNGSKTAVTQLKITALQDYTAGNNIAYALVQAGNVKFQITITQKDGSPADWEDGGNEDAELTGR